VSHRVRLTPPAGWASTLRHGPEHPISSEANWPSVGLSIWLHWYLTTRWTGLVVFGEARFRQILLLN